MLPILALPFLISLLASLVATPIVAAVARRAGFEVQPRPDRWHQRPTALMGGVAIFIACIIGLLATQVISSAGWVAQSTSLAERRIAGILGAAFIMFLLGVADDIWQFRPATKLVVQIIAAAVLVSLGVVFPLTAWVSLNIIFTMFWVIGVTNALNLLDNMDGVAVGVSGIAASFLALTFALQGHWWLAATCATLAGATFGFLPYNFNPASIFMGDSGSLMIGALLAGLCAAFPQAASGSLLSVLFVPGLIVIIPIADAMLVTVTRTMAGRSIAVGGRDHTSHRLVAMGLSEKKVALVLYAFAIAGGIIALMLQRSELGYSVSIGALFLIGLFTFAAYLSKLHSYPANEVTGNSRMTVLVSNLMYKGRALELLLDVVLFALAYYIAYVLRWDGTPPPSQVVIFDQTLAVVVACHITAFALLAVYRGVWTQLGITDLHRIAKALGLATILTAGALLMLFRNGEMSRSVLVINAICATFLTIGVRASFRSLDTIRRQGSRDGQTALIYGAGQLGELVVRELWANPAHRLHPIGFVDDDPKKHGWLVHGLPVIGGLDAVAHQPHVSAIVIGTGHISQQQLSQLQATATSSDIRLLRFDLAIRQFDGSTTAIAPATSAITAGPN